MPLHMINDFVSHNINAGGSLAPQARVEAQVLLARWRVALQRATRAALEGAEGSWALPVATELTAYSG